MGDNTGLLRSGVRGTFRPKRFHVARWKAKIMHRVHTIALPGGVDGPKGSLKALRVSLHRTTGTDGDCIQSNRQTFAEMVEFSALVSQYNLPRTRKYPVLGGRLRSTP